MEDEAKFGVGSLSLFPVADDAAKVLMELPTIFGDKECASSRGATGSVAWLSELGVRCRCRIGKPCLSAA